MKNNDVKEVRIKTEFIKLDQFLKWVGVADNGVAAKILIQDGFISVNGQEELRRGRKLYHGDIVQFDNNKFLIQKLIGDKN